jgi:hypothetical protein
MFLSQGSRHCDEPTIGGEEAIFASGRLQYQYLEK